MAPLALDLSDDQRFALMKLRRNTGDCVKPQDDDHYLLRWLRARNFNVEAAEKMLRDSLKWREKWEVESLQNWEPPDVIKKYYPSGLSGYDKDGSPVVLVPFAGLDMWGMMHSINKADFIRMTIKMIEMYLDLAAEQVKTHSELASKVIIIIDMENFNLRQYAWRPAGEVILTLIQMYEANYPEVLKACYIINAPKVFALAFSVVKNFLKEYTINKIQIFKNEPTKFQPVLLNQVPADQLPAHYGGSMTDPDGDKKCPSKIKPGGKIPKSFYIKKGEKLVNEKFTTIVVKKGDTAKIPFIADQDGSFLRWEFQSEEHDIKFGIIRTNVDGKDSEVIPIHKVNSHQNNEVGVITCAVPSTYHVVFDNSYSYLRNKKVHYAIAVDNPVVEKNNEAIGQDG